MPYNATNCTYCKMSDICKHTIDDYYDCKKYIRMKPEDSLSYLNDLLHGRKMKYNDFDLYLNVMMSLNALKIIKSKITLKLYYSKFKKRYFLKLVLDWGEMAFPLNSQEYRILKEELEEVLL